MRKVVVIILLALSFIAGVCVNRWLLGYHTEYIRLTKDIDFSTGVYESDNKPTPKVIGKIMKGSIGEISVPNGTYKRGTYQRVSFPIWLHFDSLLYMDALTGEEQNKR